MPAVKLCRGASLDLRNRAATFIQRFSKAELTMSHRNSTPEAALMRQLEFSNPELGLHGIPMEVLEYADIFMQAKSKFSCLALIKILDLVVESALVMLQWGPKWGKVVMLQGELLAWNKFAGKLGPMPHLSSSVSELRKFERH